MKVIPYLVTIFLLTISLNCAAQLSPVPKSYSLTTPEDYNKYEKDVINVINWLEQTPWNSKNGERQIANSFFLAWMSGSPTVTIELGDKILMEIMEKNKELTFSYMGGYAKYALQSRTDKTSFDINKAKLAGFKAIISKYNSEKKRSKDKNVEMLAELDSEGKLENWIATELGKK
ncbi:hypothetical protein ACFQZS_07840 [Mucilaginibacter calamicampi]|uniref:DUF4375 domain-containing protein n=1 Tax=Mucilaginibacter calamicampi TaxID=1302352 RepID=A0ABW2YXQ7_9SPHI